MLGLCVFFTSCWLPCLYICAHCYELLTLKCTAFFVVPGPQYKQGSCVCASVLWFSVCALYECVYSRPKTMALSDYISLSVEAVKGGRRTPTGYPSRLSCPGRRSDWLRPHIYLQHGFIKTHYNFQTQHKNYIPSGGQELQNTNICGILYFSETSENKGCSLF